MKTWAPLWNEIVTSSIWEEDVVTRVVWITMLAVKDREGYVSGSVASMARLANVVPKECEKAVKVLESEDRQNPRQEGGGRRIRRVEKGWYVINHAKYRDMIAEEYRRNYKAENERKRRAKKKAGGPMGGEMTYKKRYEGGASQEELDKLVDLQK